VPIPTTDKTTHFEITGELSDAAVDALADLILAATEEEQKRPHAEVNDQHADAKGK
jgi:hypothetical protein